MKRVFWISVGVAGALYAARKWEELRENNPTLAGFVSKAGNVAAVQATEVGMKVFGQVKGATDQFMGDFRAARNERTVQLAESLLAPTQGTEAELRERRAQTRANASAKADPKSSATSNRTPTPTSDEFAGDEVELGYEF